MTLISKILKDGLCLVTQMSTEIEQLLKTETTAGDFFHILKMSVGVVTPRFDSFELSRRDTARNRYCCTVQQENEADKTAGLKVIIAGQKLPKPCVNPQKQP
jgi:hypothetical protein